MQTMHHRQADRRGVLLLLVLSALTLFIMIGALMLVIATRSRTSARAFATVTESGLLQSRAALDEALMLLLRGSKSPLHPAMTESILEDRYGPTAATRLTGSFDWSVFKPYFPILRFNADALTAGTRLNGRILTLKPKPGEGDVASFRILGVSGVSIYVANVPARPSLVLPKSACEAIVNSREFVDEPYDSAASDPWLSRVQLAGGAVAAVPQASYGGAGPLECDNDNDGVADGVWLSGVIPDQPLLRGGSRQFRVSYHVLDLDGRININAAGMADRARGSYATMPDVPLGMGYGPADVDASLLVPATLPAATGLSAFTGSGTATPSGIWPKLLWGGTPAPASTVATASQRRPPPRIGEISGRYGPDGKPGIAGDDAEGNQQTTFAQYATMVAGTNAVADLKGQLKVFVTAPGTGQVTPTLTFYAAASGTDAIDDPYEARLDGDGARLAIPYQTAVSGLRWQGDSPFTVADLERVLRANDPDAAVLPQRLAAGLEERAQAARMTITTDSWDTPALTGAAALQIENAIADPSRFQALAYPWVNTNAMSPDVAAGLRFDINRPVLSGTTASALQQQHEYCKGLYTLALALGETDKTRAAQWAVNVLDFRDGDATMTGFEYDTNPANGWNVDGSVATTTDADRAVAWGVERPELLVAETAAWRDTATNASQLFVNLLRPPWNAVVRTGTGGTPQATESLHAALATSGTLNVAKVLGSGNTASSLWQVRFDAGKVVQFRAVSGTSSVGQWLVSGSTVQTGTVAVYGATTAATPLAAGGQICLHTPTPTQFTISGPRSLPVAQGGAFQLPLTSLTGTVTLERLADPGRINAADNPYIVVDTAPVNLIQFTNAPAAGTLQTRRRSGPADSPPTPLAAFWKQTWTSGSATLGNYAVTAANPAPWFHWPNRPFVSQAELALVPASDADGTLRTYSFPTSSLANGTTTVNVGGSAGSMPIGHLILDATCVPSRFAENEVTVPTFAVTGRRLGDLGLDRLNANHFSKWREPGRVNVNTIASGTSAATDAVIWTTLISGTQLALTSGTITSNPFTASGNAAAKSVGQLLSLSGTAGQPLAAQRFTSGSTLDPRDKNPFFAHAAAIRLANTATIRSHVFAVWITLETTDPTSGDPPTLRRLFAIIDRSIPVGFSEGENLNVRDTIRLQRFLE